MLSCHLACPVILLLLCLASSLAVSIIAFQLLTKRYTSDWLIDCLAESVSFYTTDSLHWLFCTFLRICLSILLIPTSLTSPTSPHRISPPNTSLTPSLTSPNSPHLNSLTSPISPHLPHLRHLTSLTLTSPTSPHLTYLTSPFTSPHSLTSTPPLPSPHIPYHNSFLLQSLAVQGWRGRTC